MGTVIDRARAASRADVCSLYVSRPRRQRPDAGRHQRPRPARGRRGAPRDGPGHHRPRGPGPDHHGQPDVHNDDRFAWIRGVDQDRFTSLCSVPLVWEEQVVGVLNVQTVEYRDFRPADIGFLEALAGLLAGLVEKSRLHAEAEAQLEQLRAIDEARANLVAVVTHALRTPLAVVRAYVELLGRRGRASRRQRGGRRLGAGGADAGRPPRRDRRLHPREPARACPTHRPSWCPSTWPWRSPPSIDGAAADAARSRRCSISFRDEPLVALASTEELHRLLGYLLENASKYAPARRQHRHLRLA